MKRERFNIRRGLDVPLAGTPDPEIHTSPPVRQVALLGFDYHGVKAKVQVAEGDRVRLGQPLFHHKQDPEVLFTAPGAGKVSAVQLGRRRALRCIIIDLEGDEEERFDSFDPAALAGLPREEVVRNLTRSGLWTALRTRPYNHVPTSESVPAAIFVTAMDTNPLAVGPEDVIADHADDFRAGLVALSRLTDGPLFVCCAPGTALPVPDEDVGLRVAEFAGPHPAGLVGTHIHFLFPVGADRSVWHIGAQDVIAVGKLFVTGRIWTERVVTLCGPMVSEPRRIRTRLGVSLSDLVRGGLEDGDLRAISGSVLSGHRATGWSAFLGRYHQQVTIIPAGGDRIFLSFMRPGFSQYTATNAYVSSLRSGRFAMTTSLNGSPRAMVPIGNLESVMPLDILPAPLLKALIVRDTDSAQALGALELDEEDLALSTFVCPSKYDYGRHLRECLEIIEKGG